MEVKVIEATEDPEVTICKAARNDYLDKWIGDMTFEEIMADIDADDEDRGSVKEQIDSSMKSDNNSFDIETEAKKQVLINHLLEHGHFGPFEHPHITISVKGISRSCMAQITRHRHVSFDIQSMRYVEFDENNPEPGEAYIEIPELDTINPAGRNVSQADAYDELSDDEILERRQEIYHNSIQDSFEEYNELLRLGVAPEHARMVLPIGTNVNMVFTLNARMLMHVADMRAAADAQGEIREMTENVLDIAEDWCPYTFEYYNSKMKNRKNRLAP